MSPRLRALTDFDAVEFSTASCPAMLLAISSATPDAIRSAAKDAILKVRSLDAPPQSILDLTLLELDYAFTNLGHFMSCVGDFQDRKLTLFDWAKRPRSPGIFYVIETRPCEPENTVDNHVAAVLGENLVCSLNREITALETSAARNHLVGKVFTVPPMSDVRWSS